MNMIKSFNNTIDYIETVLDKEIDEKKIIYLSGYSFSMFSRIFSIMTEMTFSEYIRNRKLTKAAIELREGKDKVIDIAIKYGYESSDSFSSAFKKFHGNSPTEVRNGKQFKIVSKIQLSLTIKGGREMNIRVEKKNAFKIIGKKMENIETSLCPYAWKSLYEKYTHEELSRFGNGQSYGVCYDVEDINNLNYMAAYHLNNLKKVEETDLEVMEIDETEYAILELKGSVPKCIHEGWKYAMEVFVSEQGYMHSGKPDFEVYFDGDMNSDDYEMELWIPIISIK